MSREYVYTFRVICASDDKKPDLARVEEMIDLSMQDLVYDDEFIQALDEDQSVTIRVTANFGQQTG